MKKNLSCEWKTGHIFWSCFCSQVQFSIWCYILKLTKGLNFERAQYCLISNASVFLENLCKPEPVGGALFYGNSSKFLFSNPPGLALFHIACKKFSIWSKNQIFWVRARNFFKNQVAQSIKQTQGYKLSLMIFLIFFPLFYQEMPKYGSKHGFWTWKQQLLTSKCLETKIHPTSPRHLSSKRDIAIFYLLIIMKGWSYCECVFVWLTFRQFVKHCFWCFSKHFWVRSKNVSFCKLGVSVLFCFSTVGFKSFFEHVCIQWYY